MGRSAAVEGEEMIWGFKILWPEKKNCSSVGNNSVKTLTHMNCEN